MDGIGGWIGFALSLDTVDGRIPWMPAMAALRDLVASVEEAQNDILDAISTEVALRYDRGDLTFQEGDEVMMLVWDFWLQFGDHSTGVAELTWEVFWAFDQGGFDHGDGLDAEESQTRPWIKRIVQGLP